MSNCMECGKELQVGDRVIWRCEDCARKQMEEYNNKDQRIAELEEQLANSIRPKFKIGQEVWFVKEMFEKMYSGVVVGLEVSKLYFNPLDIYYRIEYEDGCLVTDDFEDEFVFATKDEAQAKLEELGEKK